MTRRSGIPAATLRAQERRYGVPAPGRTLNGRRRYSGDDLATVIRTRQLVAEGLAPSIASQHVRQEQVPRTEHTLERN
ncbi:MAG: MerR family transcriptional regulator [Chloroflexota bacterium]